ncbi:MAG: hypothetical protein AB1921_04940 [Thermodesulfobacteriota bacterium]
MTRTRTGLFTVLVITEGKNVAKYENGVYVGQIWQFDDGPYGIACPATGSVEKKADNAAGAATCCRGRSIRSFSPCGNAASG